MTTALEWSLEIFIHDYLSLTVADEATWHYETVGIVVLTDEMCYLYIPAETCTYTLMLVKGHRDTLARTAHCNAAVNLALLNTLGKSMAEVRIVNRSIAPCAIVLYLIAILLEILENELLEWEASMIGGYANYFLFHKKPNQAFPKGRMFYTHETFKKAWCFNCYLL
jgi:hypothetical protein